MAFLPLITLISLVALRDLLPLLTMTGQALRRAPKIAATARLIADSTTNSKTRYSDRCMQQVSGVSHAKANMDQRPVHRNHFVVLLPIMDPLQRWNVLCTDPLTLHHRVKTKHDLACSIDAQTLRVFSSFLIFR